MGPVKQAEYARLPEDDQQSSSDDVPPNPWGPRRDRPSVVSYVVLFLVGVATGTLLLHILQTLPLFTHLGGPTARLQRLLQMSTEVVVFEPDERFASIPSPETDKLWNELLEPSRGFVQLENAEERFGLGPGRPSSDDPDTSIYGIAMFHQLHCLIMIREIYYGLLSGNYNVTEYQQFQNDEDHVDEDGKGDHEHSSDMSGEWFKIKHTKHCFDYLQKSIRCAGLMEVEMPQGEHLNIFSGYGSPHTCKRWGDIVDFMEQHKVTDE